MENKGLRRDFCYLFLPMMCFELPSNTVQRSRGSTWVCLGVLLGGGKANRKGESTHGGAGGGAGVGLGGYWETRVCVGGGGGGGGGLQGKRGGSTGGVGGGRWNSRTRLMLSLYHLRPPEDNKVKLFVVSRVTSSVASMLQGVVMNDLVLWLQWQ